MSDPRNAITLLSHSTALATKRWTLGPTGRPVVEDYGRGKHFECATFPVENIEELSELLTELAGHPDTFVIRGEPIPGRNLERVQRNKKLKDGEPPNFREVPRPWMMVDADKLSVEECAGIDLHTAKGCEDAIYKILGKLPLELREASCYWQLSSSAGMKPGLSAHLWFWLDRLMGETELVRWAANVNDQAGKKLVDPAVFHTVQPNYTANPVFDVGIVDPVAQRSGFLKGPKDAAVLPRHTDRNSSYLAKLAPLKDPKNQETHAHVRDACASFFCAHGPDHPAPNLLGILREAVDESIVLRGEDPAKTIYTDDKLLEEIESGRAFARDRAAQGENLAINSDGTPKATIDNIRALLISCPEWHGVIGFNERKDRPVFLREPPFEDGYKGNRTQCCPRDYSNTDDRRIASWLARKHQIQAPSFLVSEAVDVVSRESSFDPIQDYLNSLEWDGVPRLDTWLRDYLGVEENRYSTRVAAMWMIQGCARAMSPGEKADCVLALEGLQGKQKSTSLEVLAGGLQYFREGLGDIHSNDTMMCMQAAWIIELRELAGLSNREVEAIKSFLDRRNDHYRSPYDKRPEDHYRRCIFAATTNRLSYLNDESGARRWWPVYVTKVDLAGLQAVRDQLWAEALHRYRSGEQWWVEADDPDFVREQDARYDADERESVLAARLEGGCQAMNLFNCSSQKIEPKAERVSVVQILEHVFNTPLKDQTRPTQMSIAKMLTHLGWEKTKSNGLSVWKRGKVPLVPPVVSLAKNSVIPSG